MSAEAPSPDRGAPAEPGSQAASDRALLVALARLAGPLALQSIVSSALALVDALMVSGLGTVALSGVGLINRMLFVVNMALAGIASSTAVLVAQYAGAGRTREVSGPVTAALGLGLLATLPVAAVSLGRLRRGLPDRASRPAPAAPGPMINRRHGRATPAARSVTSASAPQSRSPRPAASASMM